jgi:hypothetical protein
MRPFRVMTEKAENLVSISSIISTDSTDSTSSAGSTDLASPTAPLLDIRDGGKDKEKDTKEQKDKGKTYETAKDELNKLIMEAHDPNLVKPDESPNGNTIYHLYRDGEITQQKGGYAYLQRSSFTLEYPFGRDNFVVVLGHSLKITDSLSFPCSDSQGNKYAIVTSANAYLIRGKMSEFIVLARQKYADLD